MVKKIFKNLIEYVIVGALLICLCFYMNKDIVMKALYMDDLYHWSWFRGLNLYEFAFKFYETSRYRPIFETIQYIMYVIIDTDPSKIIIFNKLYNSLVAIFIYHFIKRLRAGRIIAIIFSSLYLISHLSYYQIGQGIGNLETTSLFFSLIILFFCLKLLNVIKNYNSDNIEVDNKKNNVINTVILYIMYLLIVFTHERFLGLAVPISIAVLFSQDNDNKFINRRKIISLAMLIVLILFICYIRYIAIGKVMPAGTGGTYVENTFSLIQCIEYCFTQVAFIFGINIGPEHLVGIAFRDIVDSNIKIATYASIGIISLFIICYFIFKTKNIFFNKDGKERKNNDNYLNYVSDLIFLSFIAMCIGASSVTIRVEMRFVYVSFTISIIYLSYMSSYITNCVNNLLSKIVICLLMILIFVSRLPVEITYRKNYDKIYCFMDMSRVNSIYDNTIGKYGLDEVINNKKIYIVKKYFDMNEFYAEYIFKIYDKNNVGKKIIIVEDVSEIPIDDIGNNTIILYENLATNTYEVL